MATEKSTDKELPLATAKVMSSGKPAKFAGEAKAEKAVKTAPAKAEKAVKTAPAKAEKAVKTAPAKAEKSVKTAPAKAEKAVKTAPAKAEKSVKTAPAKAEKSAGDRKYKVLVKENPCRAGFCFDQVAALMGNTTIEAAQVELAKTHDRRLEISWAVNKGFIELLG
jgi:hypothetical protein